MHRWLPGLLALGLAPCGPGQPHGWDGETGDDRSTDDSDWDDDSNDDDPGDGDGLSVLFIGNSFTYTNDVPGIVASMAAADSIPMSVESLTQGGAYVATHLQNPELAHLLARDFDVIVINGQPFEPLLEYPLFEYGVVDLVNRAGDARVVLFQTWPSDADNIELVELGLTVDEMWMGLEHGYAEVAKITDSEIATVGAAWMSALQLEPPIGLYSIDGTHPIYAGSYLAACVIYGTIFDVACSNNGYVPAELPPEDVVRLQVVADITNGKLDP